MQTPRTRTFYWIGRVRVLRAAILLVVLWQAASAIMPHPGLFSGATSERPHWHGAGDPLELAHDETACPVCTLQQTARAHAQAVRLPADVIKITRFYAVSTRSHTPSASAVTYARGPPPLS